MFVRQKNGYYYVVEAYRNEEGKPRQRVLVYLGEYETVEDAIRGLPSSVEFEKRLLQLFSPRTRAQVGPRIERRIARYEKRLQKLQKLVGEQGDVDCSA